MRNIVMCVLALALAASAGHAQTTQSADQRLDQFYHDGNAERISQEVVDGTGNVPENAPLFRVQIALHNHEIVENKAKGAAARIGDYQQQEEREKRAPAGETRQPTDNSAKGSCAMRRFTGKLPRFAFQCRHFS